VKDILSIPFKRLGQDPLGLVLIALTLFCVVGDFFIIRASFFDGDNVANFNELASVWSGNILLHGWSLTTDNFYLSDLVPCFLASAVFGITPELIYIVPTIIMVLFIFGCLLLVWQTGQTARQRKLGGIAIILFIGLPFADPQSIFRVAACHAAVITYSIYGLLIAARLLDATRPSLWLLAVFDALTFITTSSDPQIILYFVLPLVALLGLRFWLFATISKVEILLGINMAIFAAIGSAFPYGLGHLGGFLTTPNVSGHFVASIPALVQNIRQFTRDLLASFDASSIVLTGLAGHRLIALSRLVCFIAVIFFCARIFWNTPRTATNEKSNLIGQWLLMGIVLLSAADLMSQLFSDASSGAAGTQPIFSFRYVTPIYVYASLAAVIEGQNYLSKVKEKSWLRILNGIFAVLSIIFLFGAVQATVQDARKPAYLAIAPERPVAAWLESNHLSYGVGDYWTTQMVTALSDKKVIADPVTDQGRLVPFPWIGNDKYLYANRPPQFVVFTPVNGWNISLQTITATYGAPAAVYNVNGYTIAVLKPQV
jgi:hypothetical protein